MDILKPRLAGELMIPLDEYPHVPYWFTLREGVALIHHAKIVVNGRKSLARALLVFNEEYQLLGMVRRRDILRGLEPESMFGTHAKHSKQIYDVHPDPNLLELTYDALLNNVQNKANLKISEIMVPIKQTVDVHDRIMTVIYKLNETGASMLPVLKDKVVVGVIRTVEVMDEIAKMLGIIE